MKNPADKKTLDLLPEHDLAGERPKMPTKASARVKAWREAHGVVPVTVNLPIEVNAGLERYIAKYLAKGVKKNKAEVIADLIRKQMMRPR